MSWTDRISMLLAFIGYFEGLCRSVGLRGGWPAL